MLDPSKDDEQETGVWVAGCQFLARDDGKASEGVQFIDRAIGFDACRIFRNALASGETCFPRIAAFCINTVKSNARVVECFFVHTHMLRFGRRIKLPWLASPTNRIGRS